ncbi:hypothetical protein PLESTB_000365900 [Pleodorina starrii]|uniref:Protein kinase domain-containing protein n=1 Tax=Pleodorina starrii TaxID=330485 RepID=A0A9W6BEW2_9CHLO|nr:hypothetical protein PLESTB_000365900 [Pleodorina starrii]
MAWQLARALKHLHERKIAYRDIRPANLMLDDSGVLRLADFGGTARSLRPSGSGSGGDRNSWPASPHSHSQPLPLPQPLTLPLRAATPSWRWYQPPEVLSSNQYGYAADVWSYGCTVAELATGKPLFPGASEADQLLRIMKFCGLPPYDPYGFLHDKLSAAGAAAADTSGGNDPKQQALLVRLLESCLRLDPNDRVTMDDILVSPYFLACKR